MDFMNSKDTYACVHIIDSTAVYFGNGYRSLNGGSSKESFMTFGTVARVEEITYYLQEISLVPRLRSLGFP